MTSYQDLDAFADRSEAAAAWTPQLSLEPSNLIAPIALPRGSRLPARRRARLGGRPPPAAPAPANPPGGLATHARGLVGGGACSFVVGAKDFGSFGQAIVKKMIAEIADATPPDKSLPQAQ